MAKQLKFAIEGELSYIIHVALLASFCTFIDD